MSPAVRRWLVRAHLWAGLAVGWVIVIIAVAGAVMVFRPQLNPLVDPELFAVKPPDGPRASLDVLTANARVTFPEGQLWQVLLFVTAPSVAILVLTGMSSFLARRPATIGAR